MKPVAHAVLDRHGRSFSHASRFLRPEDRDDVAVMYAFCRMIDDLADELDDDEVAHAELDRVERELLVASDPRQPLHGPPELYATNSAPDVSATNPVTAAFVEVCTRRRVDLAPAHTLIATLRCDLGGVCLADDDALLRYCRGVAGTVGLMMCGILGVPEAGHPHASDLGVAMQITNVCRDVLEDARRGRTYLPATRLRAVGVDPGDLLSGTADRVAVASVVRDLLAIADSYYASGDKGLRYIPPRSRFAIIVASRLYRGIGVKLLRRHRGDALSGRTSVSVAGKALLVAASVVRFVSSATD